MNTWNIAVVSHAIDESPARRICAQIERAWDCSPPATFTNVTPQELDEARIASIDAAVVIASARAGDTALSRCLAGLEDHHVPVLALLDEPPKPGSVFEISGTLVDGRDTAAPVHCARLQGMLHRQREVNRLRRDLAVVSRAEGGLVGQVTRIQDELHLAAQAQREFLPGDLPVRHGVSFAALWRPAHYVSGDIYDVIPLDDDHLGLFVADAVGHGVSAALMTMVILQSLTTRVHEGPSLRILPPGEVLAQLNERLLRRRAQPGRFATAVYGVVNCRERTLTLAGAGHPPPLLSHDSGSPEALQTSGGLLGVFDDETYDQIEVELAVGDRLVIYTDGFEQAFPPVAGDDRDRTRRYLREFEALGATCSPADMIDTINHRLDLAAGSLHQVDDLTMLCMHAGPLVAARVEATVPVHV